MRAPPPRLLPPPRAALAALVAFLVACGGDAERPAPQPRLPPAPAELSVQAVDAGTGEALADAEWTVRYLVRSPITLDASGVERVPAAEPYRIAHDVDEDSLVVELRLEAPSYARLDTVLAVARGGAAGPFRVALARRGRGAAPAAAARPAAATPPAAASAAPIGTGADDPADAAADRTGMRAGDAAFQRGDWRGAVASYRRMQPPRGRGPYARDYTLALVRLGISQINQGAWPGAYEALREAVDLDPREYTGYFYLGQVECALGRFDEGRRTLSQVERLAPGISEAQRPIVLVTIDYQRAVCSHGQFQQARTAAEAQATAARALGEFDAFIARGEAMRPVPAPVQQAIADARRRVIEIAGR